MALDKKAKKRLEVLRQRLQKLQQQLVGAKQQEDEPRRSRADREGNRRCARGNEADQRLNGQSLRPNAQTAHQDASRGGVRELALFIKARLLLTRRVSEANEEQLQSVAASGREYANSVIQN